MMQRPAPLKCFGLTEGDDTVGGEAVAVVGSFSAMRYRTQIIQKPLVF